MSLPVPSWDNLKRWIDFWTKFKGKKVRVWFSGEPVRFCTPEGGGTAGILRLPDRPVTDPMLRRLGASPTVEGTISSIVEQPLGIMLEDVILWEIHLGKKGGKFIPKTVRKVDPEIKAMFIPTAEIARIDFLG